MSELIWHLILSIVAFFIASPHILPLYVARASQRRYGGMRRSTQARRYRVVECYPAQTICTPVFSSRCSSLKVSRTQYLIPRLLGSFGAQYLIPKLLNPGMFFRNCGGIIEFRNVSPKLLAKLKAPGSCHLIATGVVSSNCVRLLILDSRVRNQQPDPVHLTPLNITT
jgi:hypothetical protein